jgi:hypothetical protein
VEALAYGLDTAALVAAFAAAVGPCSRLSLPFVDVLHESALLRLLCEGRGMSVSCRSPIRLLTLPPGSAAGLPSSKAPREREQAMQVVQLSAEQLRELGGAGLVRGSCVGRAVRFADGHVACWGALDRQHGILLGLQCDTGFAGRGYEGLVLASLLEGGSEQRCSSWVPEENKAHLGVLFALGFVESTYTGVALELRKS